MAMPLPELVLLEAIDLAGFALPRGQGWAVERVLRTSLDRARNKLISLARTAVTRHVAASPTPSLFTPAETAELADVFAGLLSLARVLGRAVILSRLRGLRNRGKLAEGNNAAAEFLLSLSLALGTDPQRGGPELKRRAFTLAVATETELLDRVRNAIANAVAAGDLERGPKLVKRILDEAGVSNASDGYARMVFRTNVKSAYDDTLQAELSQSTDTFPVWRYSNPVDDRSRPEHAARNGNYYPSSVPFTQIRGTDIAQVANCRCVAVPIDKWAWADLKKSGARMADGYSDPTATAVAPARVPLWRR